MKVILFLVIALIAVWTIYKLYRACDYTECAQYRNKSCTCLKVKNARKENKYGKCKHFSSTYY